MNFEDIEDQDGIRLSWNTFSATPAENARAVIPIAAMYTPLHENERMTIEQYDPVACRAPCRAVLNPYWYVCIHLGLQYTKLFYKSCRSAC